MSRTTVLVFVDDVLTEPCNGWMEHLQTSAAFVDEPGYLGGTLAQEGDDWDIDELRRILQNPLGE